VAANHLPASEPPRRAFGLLRVRLAGSQDAIADWRARFEVDGLVADPDLRDPDVVLLSIADEDSATAPLRVRELRLRLPNVPVVVAGRFQEPVCVRALWRAGAADVLFRDESSDAVEVLGRAVERHRLLAATNTTLERYTAGLGERSRNLERALSSLDQSYEETLRALIRSLDAREQEVAGHSHRVALWTLYLAVSCGVPEEQLRDIHRGALLHDIGKIGIPDQILLKRGELDDSEWAVMRNHPRIGFDILSNVEHLKVASEIPYAHHEKWNGNGYPRGLEGEAIPLGARLFAIVDVYDALRSERPYKVALDREATMNILQAESGRHFDPSLVARFAAVPAEAWDRLNAPDLALLSFPELRERVQSVAARHGASDPRASEVRT
jgi:response regulator RpfG family c-di-GMP phosphodiesterase